MTKSTESNAILYTTEMKLPTFEIRRFVFRDGDMSAACLQAVAAGTDFKSVAQSLKDWDEKGYKPSMKLIN